MFRCPQKTLAYVATSMFFEIRVVNNQIAFCGRANDNPRRQKLRPSSRIEEGQTLAANVLPLLGSHLSGFTAFLCLLDQQFYSIVESIVHRQRFPSIDAKEDVAIVFAHLKEMHCSIDDFIGGAIFAAL